MSITEYDWPLGGYYRFRAANPVKRYPQAFHCHICGNEIAHQGMKRFMRGDLHHEMLAGGKPFCIVCSETCEETYKLRRHI
jgi:hypothetical protein